MQLNNQYLCYGSNLLWLKRCVMNATLKVFCVIKSWNTNVIVDLIIVFFLDVYFPQ